MERGRKFSVPAGVKEIIISNLVSHKRKAQPFAAKIHAVRVAGYNCPSVVGSHLQAGPMW